MIYNFGKLKSAIMFNTVEVLPTDETQLDEEIKALIENANQSGEPIKHYIGFEISGKVHIGTGMMTAIKIKALQDAGVKCSIFLADYHSWLNNKLDGTLETPREVAKKYFGPVMLKCCEIVGCDVTDIELILANDIYHQKNQKGLYFWDYMLQSARNLTLARVNKSVSITGKDAGEGVEFGILCYPVMQVADSFFMQTHIVHAGMDQRKCHVLMREVASKVESDFSLQIKNQKTKQIALHHKLLLGLGISAKDTQKRMTIQTSESLKMSKSKADSAVWVHDSYEEINQKFKKAYCPMPQENQTKEGIEAEQEFNPILQWLEFLIYPAGKIVAIQRPEKFGGNKTYQTLDELKADYFTRNLHPLDLKSGVAKTLAEWFRPIKDWVEQNPEGLKLLE